MIRLSEIERLERIIKHTKNVAKYRYYVAYLMRLKREEAIKYTKERIKGL